MVDYPMKEDTMGLSQELQTGKAGEHLVCCDLIQKGYNAFLADQGLPYDVLVDIDGQIKRVQVKTSARKREAFWGGYSFSLRTAKFNRRNIEANTVDYVAFAFLDKRIVQYIPVSLITSQKGFLTGIINFYEAEKASGGNRRKYIIGRFNDL